MIINELTIIGRKISGEDGVNEILIDCPSL